MSAPVRPPGWTRPAAARRAICSGWGWPGAAPWAVADLAIMWLLPDPKDPAGPPRAARFCRACAPTGPLEEISCTGCGDGPLLTGALAEPTDLATSAAVEAWLDQAGWRWRIGHWAGPWCPDCAPTVQTRAVAVHPARLR